MPDQQNAVIFQVKLVLSSTHEDFVSMLKLFLQDYREDFTVTVNSSSKRDA
jgi:hypothetical protein